MNTHSPLFADEVVACVSEGRDPTIRETFSVAARIWKECSHTRSAFSWDALPRDSTDRIQAIRNAQLALCGEADPEI